MTDSDDAQATATFEHALPIGTTLSEGQFTVTDHLGSGGFGITYRAHDNILGRTIVIKECFPVELCRRTGSNVAVHNTAYSEPFANIVDMFMREARSLAQIRHPNIVGVHGAFEENQTAYMALDLIDGQDLHDLMVAEDFSLSPSRVRKILVQLLDAIEKIHNTDLLHRDISPDNIMIEQTGAPVLIDFGAARTDASRHTRALSSVVVVKDGYSPQEFYVAGSVQTPSSDLYALAASFYHVITGRAPVHSQTRLVDIAAGKPDPCKPLAGRIDGFDTTFLEAIDQAMRVHPADRIQSAGKWKSIIAQSAAQAGSPSAMTSAGDVGDLNLERSLKRLVKETNVELQKSQRVPVATKPAPEPINEVPKLAWAEEFNSTMSIPAEDAALEKDDIDDNPPVHSPPTPERSQRETSKDTNWIDRAKEKQARLRSDQERLLGLPDATSAPSAQPTDDAAPQDEATATAPPRPLPQSLPSQGQVTKKLVAGFLVCCSAVFVLKTFDLTLKKPAEVATVQADEVVDETDANPVDADEIVVEAPEASTPEPAQENTPPRVIQLGNSGGVRWHSVQD